MVGSTRSMVGAVSGEGAGEDNLGFIPMAGGGGGSDSTRLQSAGSDRRVAPFREVADNVSEKGQGASPEECIEEEDFGRGDKERLREGVRRQL